MQIPDELLAPFFLDEAEQQCAVRCYQLAKVAGNGHGLNVHFLGDARHGPRGPTLLNSTYLPLLKEIAAHDSNLQPLLVRGQAVADFAYRRRAAQAAAAITKEEAAYAGLDGEVLDSDAFPEPYKNQDQLLARFVVDSVKKARLPQTPRSDGEWKQVENFRTGLLDLREKFGMQVLEAIRVEAERRQVDMTHVLPAKDG